MDVFARMTRSKRIWWGWQSCCHIIGIYESTTVKKLFSEILNLHNFACISNVVDQLWHVCGTVFALLVV